MREAHRIKRITHIDPANQQGRAKELLDDVTEGSAGPNMTKTMAVSSTMAKGLSGAAVCSPRARSATDRVETSEISGCEYCRAARSFIGKNADKLPDETISRADMVEGPTPSPTSR